ncbi:MAG: RNA 3'-terminal phosphate cyclase [bacterium]
MAQALLELDGAHGEGGGQIVRTGLFLSLLLRKPFHMTRIRAGRDKPGLKPQHVAILRLLAEMTESQADGAVPGATELTFTPGRLRPGSWQADIGTAGCIPLVLQTVLPIAVATAGTTRVEITGGTHVPFGPTVDWMERAYLPWLRRLADVDLRVERVGFAPEGGGRVAVEVHQPAVVGTPEAFRAHAAARLGERRIAQGKVRKVTIRSIAATGIGREVARRQALAAYAQLATMGAPHLDIVDVESDGLGSAVTCSLEDDAGNVLASDRLGNRGTSAESVGKIAATNLVEDWHSGATVDRHLADHLVPWVALGAGAVRIPHATPHLTTNAWVCEQFLGVNCVRTDRNLLR